MPTIPICSIDDPHIAAYRDIQRARSAERSRRFIAEGKWLTERLLRSSWETESILVDDQRLAEIEARVPARTTIYVMSRKLVDAVVGFNFHRGVLACGVRPPAQSCRQQIAAFDSSCWTAVACVGVCDPENLGAILRNCAAFGVQRVILGPGCADYLSRRVLRVSMGTVFSLSVMVAEDFADLLRNIRNDRSADVTATVLDSGAEHLADYRSSDRTVLLFGSEGHGVEERWIDLCNRRLTIPMRLGTDSLNVAVASGIVLHCLEGR